MELHEFLIEIRQEIDAEVAEGAPYREVAFFNIVSRHLASHGITFDPESCPYGPIDDRGIVRMSGYALSDEADRLDLFVILFADVDSLVTIPDGEATRAAEQSLRFLKRCAEGTMANRIEISHPAHSLALTLQEIYNTLDEIRVFVLTDRQRTATGQFGAREIAGKTIRLEVMDIGRLFRHMSEGRPRDELVVNFEEVSGGPIPCVFVPGGDGDYDYALTAFPGEALRHIYEKFGTRLLEANVRSFLDFKSKSVNTGIQETLRKAPRRFMAFNNGIVVIADEIRLAARPDGTPGLTWIRGMQIVNGGQTTASLYFTKRKFPETDLSEVRVPAKIIVMKSGEEADQESMVSDISRFANTQNAVKQSDLAANKPFHVEVERRSVEVYCPDGQGRWFYERAAGSYNTFLARESGGSAARLQRLKEAIPTARRFTKTDLARYLNAWAGHVDRVSQGAQKNFRFFMDTLSPEAPGVTTQLSATEYKHLVARAILYRTADKVIRPLYPAFQANVTTYTMGVLAQRLGDSLDLDRIWAEQRLSEELREQIVRWSAEVHRRLHDTAGGKMISEWAKRPECAGLVLGADYSATEAGIPEVMAN